MSIHHVNALDPCGVLRKFGDRWAIYAAFAPSGNGSETFVKIGISTKVYDRLCTLRCWCPFRMDVALMTMVGDVGAARAAERELHSIFADHRTSGEWFRFDMASELDKELFHTATRRIIQSHSGVRLAWRKITATQLADYASECVRQRKKRTRV